MANDPAPSRPRELTLPDDVESLTPPSDFAQRCATHGIAFDDTDLPRLGQYLALVLETNRVMNLTSITDPQQAWHRHIEDSLTLLPLLASCDAQRVIDVGSGAGMPGLPLAITMPDTHFTLVEATAKKARFLELVMQRLELRNVAILAERAETIGRDRRRYREQFDVALVRAVGHLAIVLELCLPLVRVGGVVLAVKGARADAEIAQSAEALRLLHGAVTQTIDTPTGRIVAIEKLRTTPKLYPRRPGEPKRAPLGVSSK